MKVKAHPNPQTPPPLTLPKQPLTNNHLTSATSSDSLPHHQNASQNSDQSHFMPTGLPPQHNNFTNVSKNEQQYGQIDMKPVIQQHRLFLQNYKRERGEQIRMIRDRYFSTHKPAEQSYVQEQPENCVSQEQQEEQSEKSPYAEAISSKLQHIQRKIEKEIIRQPANSEMRRFKIFDGVVSSKNDLQRVAKERRFVRSQQEKYDYQQPQMPHRHLMPLKFRVNTQPFSDQVDLTRKAREFIEKVHREQQNLLGKQILRKKKQEFKRIKQQRQEQMKQQELQEIKKEERRLKAEQNLLVMREKLKINKIVNRNSIEELRKILTEKQYRLQAMQQLVKQNENEGKPHKSYSICSKLESKVRRSSASDYSQDQQNQLRPNNKQLNISIDKLKRLQEKETNIRAKLKLGTKKHKAIRPTEYSENYLQREAQESRIRTDYGQVSEVKQTVSKQTQQGEFLNTQLNLSLKKSTRSVLDNKQNVIANKQKPEYLTQNGNSVSITEPQSMAEWAVREKSRTQFENKSEMDEQGSSSKKSKKGEVLSSLT